MSGTVPFSGAPVGAPEIVSVQNFLDLVAAAQNSVQALGTIAKFLGNSYIALAGANVFTGLNTFNGTTDLVGPVNVTGAAGFTKPVQLPVSTVSGLPAIILSQVGSLAYASNGRNTGEGAAAGTGCVVQVQNKSGTATWCAIWSGVAVTA